METASTDPFVGQWVIAESIVFYNPDKLPNPFPLSKLTIAKNGTYTVTDPTSPWVFGDVELVVDELTFKATHKEKGHITVKITYVERPSRINGSYGPLLGEGPSGTFTASASTQEEE